MSFTSKRQDIADALSTVDGVNGFAKRPSIPNVGDAWSVMGGMERAAGDAFLVTWLVRVLCPQDDEAAVTWWDEHWESLFYALKPHGHITRTDPIVLAVERTDQLAYQITMTAEE